MKRVLLSALVLSVAAMGTQAKSWKIGPSSVNGMDFASINAAMESNQVNAGDTLFLDQYFSTAAKQTVTKKVVIIGTGYDTSFTDEKVVATLTDSLILKVDGIQVKSVKLNNVKFYADECVLDRCYVNYIQIGTVPKGMNHIYSCYITGQVGNRIAVTTTNTSSISGPTTTTTYYPAQFDIQNCVISPGVSGVSFSSIFLYLTNSIINNNTFYRAYNINSHQWCLSGITSSQITNNIIYWWNSNTSSSNTYLGGHCMYSDVYAVGSDNTIEHNIMSQTTPSNYPDNVYSTTIPSLFVATGNYSDYYKLKTEVTDNYALNYATDGKEVGCHGGMFGCPSGGRPQYIPYFTKVVVGQRTENGKLPVSLEVKIQDK